MYVDAVDWVTAPNVLGMSQHADHGVVGTKPYAARGRYIHRMSNYCSSCPYDVTRRVGAKACPFNCFYWEFLFRHRKRLAGNQRMALTLRNVDRIQASERRTIRSQAQRLRQELGIGRISG
jgi:deoxyribodipyrimidine photolyase-related protein